MKAYRNKNYRNKNCRKQSIAAASGEGSLEQAAAACGELLCSQRKTSVKESNCRNAM